MENRYGIYRKEHSGRINLIEIMDNEMQAAKYSGNYSHTFAIDLNTGLPVEVYVAGNHLLNKKDK